MKIVPQFIVELLIISQIVALQTTFNALDILNGNFSHESAHSSVHHKHNSKGPDGIHGNYSLDYIKEMHLKHIAGDHQIVDNATGSELSTNNTNTTTGIANFTQVSLTFTERAHQLYNKILPCLLDSPVADKKRLEKLRNGPPADLEQHFYDILNHTADFRGINMHEYHYTGPWIENLFIQRFMHQPYTYFHGMIPLFIQFVDIHCDNENTSHANPTQVIEKLQHVLRKDVIYLVISQDDQGIGTLLLKEFPNILVMSAGGYGHIPIPLIMGNMSYHDPPANNSFKYEVGFYGNTRPALSRSRILLELQSHLRNVHMSYKTENTPNWASLMLETKFNLAPRGYGRSSFRLVEVIHSGRIPVYLYDDYKWIPYEHTEANIEHFGYIGQHGKTQQVVNEMKRTTNEQYNAKLRKVKELRHYYTYEGVLEQIELFLNDPLGAAGGFLRCIRVPEKDHRRLSDDGYDLDNDVV